MNWSRKVRMIGAHAEGEIGRVIVDGAPEIPGETMLERLTWLNAHGDDLRRFTLFEPRGAAQMTINLLTSPCTPGAHAGFIPMQGDGSHAMSGSNAMCVATVLLESGIVDMQPGLQRINLDTAAGPVTALADCKDGKVRSVSLDFFPSFAERMDVPIELEGHGAVTVDIAFGGVFYVLVDAGQFGLEIGPGAARDLVSIGNLLLQAARAQLSVQHPLIADFGDLEFC
ncbi:MAG: proline racemase family protein, partial [Pseudomonadota bacterium]